MKVVVINQKVALARHWFKWYIVARAGKDWQPLKIEKYRKERSISEIKKSLNETEN